jgi:hypothetical protein
MEVPRNRWFIMDNNINMDDLGYPYSRKPPFVDSYFVLRLIMCIYIITYIILYIYIRLCVNLCVRFRWCWYFLAGFSDLTHAEAFGRWIPWTNHWKMRWVASEVNGMVRQDWVSHWKKYLLLYFQILPNSIHIIWLNRLQILLDFQILQWDLKWLEYSWWIWKNHSPKCGAPPTRFEETKLAMFCLLMSTQEYPRKLPALFGPDLRWRFFGWTDGPTNLADG